MDAVQEKCLRENRVSIVSDLEPRGKVIDTLYEDGILTENDLELVSSAKTRKERCHILLSLLPTRGPSAYGSFRKALDAGRYDFLANQLIPANSEIVYHHDSSSQRNRACTKKCQQCTMFLEKVRSRLKDPNVFIYKIVTNHCCLLLDNIEPKDLIDQLFQDRVITADDIDRIVTRTTRRDRCETLFEILLTTQNNEVVESLKLALLKKYSYIVENISNEFDDKKTAAKASASQTQEGIRGQHVTSSAQVLLKARLFECPAHNSGGNYEDSDVTPKVLAAGQEEISSGTLAELSLPDRDENNETDLKTSAKCLVKVSTGNNNVMIYNDGQSDTKHVNDGNDCVDGAFVDTSVKQLYSETISAQKGNCNIKTKTTENIFETRAVSCLKDISHSNSENGNLPKGKRCRQKKHKAINLAQNITHIAAEDDEQDIVRNPSEKELVPKQITSIEGEKPSRRLIVAFNYLSTLINQGSFDKFEDISFKLRNRFPSNFDLMCIIGYLQTSRDLFQTDFDSAKSHIDSTMALVPKTSNPRYFTLELFTAKTRMYITQKKLEKLQTTLDEAMMILETDPAGCTGRAAGWLYINDARNRTAQLSCLNLKKPSALKVYERLFEKARTSFQRSMTNFKCDGGKDGPFGFGYALCRLVILLLRCGDNGLTMNVLTPSADDIQTAGQYLQHLEDSNIAISKILDMHFRLAKCDYQFRRGNCVRALEHAEIAHDLATEMRLLEFTEHAHNRVSFLKPKLSAYVVADGLSEEETQRILFEESSDTDCHSQSE